MSNPGRVSLPNLVGLALRDEPAPAAPGLSVAYEDRLDDVVGGCTPTTPLGTACYDDWVMALTNGVLGNPSANTLVLLSVGHGVLELRAVRQLLAIRAENNQSAIKDLILIDPGLEDQHVVEAVIAYTDALAGVVVRYFTGNRAYDHALKAFLDDTQMVVAAIGALNFGYVMSTHKIHRNLVNTMIALVEMIEGRNTNVNNTVFVVQAFQNTQGLYFIRNDTTSAFKMRFIPLLEEFTRLHLEGPN